MKIHVQTRPGFIMFGGERASSTLSSIDVALEGERDAVVIAAVEQGRGADLLALGMIHPAELQLLELGRNTGTLTTTYPSPGTARSTQAGT